jgi:hypothetical protein
VVTVVNVAGTAEDNTLLRDGALQLRKCQAVRICARRPGDLLRSTGVSRDSNSDGRAAFHLFGHPFDGSRKPMSLCL